MGAAESAQTEGQTPSPDANASPAVELKQPNASPDPNNADNASRKGRAPSQASKPNGSQQQQPPATSAPPATDAARVPSRAGSRKPPSVSTDSGSAAQREAANRLAATGRSASTVSLGRWDSAVQLRPEDPEPPKLFETIEEHPHITPEQRALQEKLQKELDDQIAKDYPNLPPRQIQQPEDDESEPSVAPKSVASQLPTARSHYNLTIVPDVDEESMGSMDLEVDEKDLQSEKIGHLYQGKKRQKKSVGKVEKVVKLKEPKVVPLREDQEPIESIAKRKLDQVSAKVGTELERRKTRIDAREDANLKAMDAAAIAREADAPRWFNDDYKTKSKAFMRKIRLSRGEVTYYLRVPKPALEREAQQGETIEGDLRAASAQGATGGNNLKMETVGKKKKKKEKTTTTNDRSSLLYTKFVFEDFADGKAKEVYPVRDNVVLEEDLGWTEEPDSDDETDQMARVGLRVETEADRKKKELDELEKKQKEEEAAKEAEKKKKKQPKRVVLEKEKEEQDKRESEEQLAKRKREALEKRRKLEMKYPKEQNMTRNLPFLEFFNEATKKEKERIEDQKKAMWIEEMEKREARRVKLLKEYETFWDKLEEENKNPLPPNTMIVDTYALNKFEVPVKLRSRPKNPELVWKMDKPRPLVPPGALDLIVMLHDATAYSYQFYELATDLVNRGYSVLTFDFYGRGGSPWPIEEDRNYAVNCDVNLLVEQTHELLQYLGMMEKDMEELLPTTEKKKKFFTFTLMGFDIGAAVAAQFADTFPRVVEQLILAGPQGLPLPTSCWEGCSLLFTVNIKETTMLRQQLDQFYDLERCELYLDRCEEEITYQVANTPGYLKAMLSTMQSFPYGRLARTYSALGHDKRPILILWGQQDDVTPFPLLKKMQKLLPASPNIEIKTIENCGHNMLYEAHTIVATEILGFMQKHNHEGTDGCMVPWILEDMEKHMGVIEKEEKLRIENEQRLQRLHEEEDLKAMEAEEQRKREEKDAKEKLRKERELARQRGENVADAKLELASSEKTAKGASASAYNQPKKKVAPKFIPAEILRGQSYANLLEKYAMSTMHDEEAAELRKQKEDEIAYRLQKQEEEEKKKAAQQLNEQLQAGGVRRTVKRGMSQRKLSRTSLTRELENAPKDQPLPVAKPEEDTEVLEDYIEDLLVTVEKKDHRAVLRRADSRLSKKSTNTAKEANP